MGSTWEARPEYAARRITPPANDPVTLVEAKQHLNELSGDFDLQIANMIKQATDHLDGVDGLLGRAIVSQVWQQSFDHFRPRLRLPMPASAVQSVTYIAGDGSVVSVNSNDFALRHDARGSFVEPGYRKVWPASRGDHEGVKVQFSAGWSLSDVPPAIRAAILIIVGDLWSNRESGVIGTGSSEIVSAASVESLIEPYRFRFV